MKLLGYAYFTAQKTVVITLAQDDMFPEKLKAYIACAGGLDEEEDLDYTMDYGAKFPVKDAISVIRSCGTIVNPETFDDIIEEADIR